jgi:spore coat protein U-like protein
MKHSSPVRRFAAAMACAVMLSTAAPLQAGSLQGTLNLSITFWPSCSSVSVAQPLAFGNYTNGQSQHLDAPLVVVNGVCDGFASGTVYLDGGQHLNGTTRRMSNGAGGYLNYEVYRAGDYGAPNAYGLSVSNGHILGVGAGGPGTASIYGRVFSGQSATPGNYSDTLLVTLSW